MHERVDRERLSFGQREPAGVHGVEQFGVAGGRDDDGDRRVVLSRATHHRWPADVDLLDDLVGDAAPGRGFAKRIQVRHHEVERLDAELGQLAHMLGLAGVGQQPGVHLRVQRLHPAVEALGKSGEVFDLQHGDPGLGQHRSRRSGRDDLHAGSSEPAAEFDDARLVVDADERAPDGSPAVGGRSFGAHGMVTFLPTRSSPRGRSGRWFRRAGSARLS